MMHRCGRTEQSFPCPNINSRTLGVCDIEGLVRLQWLHTFLILLSGLHWKGNPWLNFPSIHSDGGSPLLTSAWSLPLHESPGDPCQQKSMYGRSEQFSRFCKTNLRSMSWFSAIEPGFDQPARVNNAKGLAHFTSSRKWKPENPFNKRNQSNQR